MINTAFYQAIEEFAKEEECGFVYDILKLNNGDKIYRVDFLLFPSSVEVYFRGASVDGYSDEDYPILKDMLGEAIDQEYLHHQYLAQMMNLVGTEEDE